MQGSSHQVEIPSQLHTRVDLLLLLLDDSAVGIRLALLPRLDISSRSIHATRLNDFIRMGVLMAMAVRVIMAGAAGRNSQPLIHSNKDHEADQDTQSQQQVSVRLNHDERDLLIVALADEDLREQVEEGVAQKTPHREGDHDRQRGRVDICRA